ncbi:MAG: fasciclin domain-containing protein, partial [Akkermansiaceae bacterium]
IFAPKNEAWNSEPYQSLLENPSQQSREAIFAILARHVITGKHVSENPVPYEKLRTIHGAPIYLTVDEGKTNIQNVEIIEADLEAFNGLVNVIDKVIADPMELPENDLTRIDAIRFTQAALIDGAKLYDKGRYQECFEFFARRGYELVDKYGSRGYFKTNLLSTVALSRDPVREFADNAWDSRNAFRAVLREIELNEDSLGDLLEVNGDPTSKIGR